MYEPRPGEDYLVDHYAVLGVGREAGAAEIQSAFRQRQKEWHPDRYAGLAPQMQAQAARQATVVNEAYAVLQDPARRAAYDEQLAGWSGPLSSDGTPIVDLGRGGGGLIGLLGPDEGRQRAEELALQMSGFSADTLAVLEPLVAAQGEAVTPELRRAYQEALERQGVYLALCESFLQELAGIDTDLARAVGPGYADEARQQIGGWKTAAEQAAQGLVGELASGGQLALAAGVAGGKVVGEVELAALLSERIAEVSRELEGLAQRRAEVAAKRLESLRPRYLPAGRVLERPSPRLALGVAFGEEVALWLGLCLEGDTVSEDRSIDVAGLPETAAALVAQGVDVLVVDHAEGLATGEEIDYAVNWHLAPLVESLDRGVSSS